MSPRCMVLLAALVLLLASVQTAAQVNCGSAPYSSTLIILFFYLLPFGL